MKNRRIQFIVAALVGTTLHASAQGSLTPPPGAPAPVMKSLDQVEARIPLVAGQPGVSINVNGTISITQPGSYYLTGNVTISAFDQNGIFIGATDSVTLDLNGFTVRHTHVSNTSNSGIFISGASSQAVTIRNGHIRGPGFERGIMLNSTPAGTLLVDSVSVIGVDSAMLLQKDLGRTVITNCLVTETTTMGIFADLVKDCTVRNAGGLFPGISATTVLDCSVEQESGTASAIEARLVQNSVGISSGGTGITADNASNCIGTSTSGPMGMNISGTASFCRASRPSGTAISAGIAIGCTTGGGTITSPQKHLGTP